MPERSLLVLLVRGCQATTRRVAGSPRVPTGAERPVRSYFQYRVVTVFIEIGLRSWAPSVLSERHMAHLLEAYTFHVHACTCHVLRATIARLARTSPQDRIAFRSGCRCYKRTAMAQ